MPERDPEQWEERDDRDATRPAGRAHDERAITLSGLLGETPEEASRRPLPRPPALRGSPRKSLLLVGFSAVVVACLVALGALANHSGAFPGFLTDHQTGGLSDAAPGPGDENPVPERPDPGPADRAPGPADRPDLAPVPGTSADPGRKPDSGPGVRSDAGQRSGANTGPGPRPSSASGSGPARGAGAGSADPGTALGTPASRRAPSVRNSNGGGDGRDADDHNADQHDADQHGADHNDSDHRDGGDHPASRPHSDAGGGLLQTVESVLGGLTDVADPGALAVTLTDSWHDESGHDHSGRRGDHAGLRAATAGVAPGVRLPGR